MCVYLKISVTYIYQCHIFTCWFSENRVGVQKCQIISPPHFRQSHQPDSVCRDPNSRHLDKCCTAGLGTSTIWSLCCSTNSTFKQLDVLPKIIKRGI